jgi:serine phosphatase RsbU (regulator of sigma subunit)
MRARMSVNVLFLAWFVSALAVASAVGIGLWVEYADGGEAYFLDPSTIVALAGALLVASLLAPALARAFPNPAGSSAAAARAAIAVSGRSSHLSLPGLRAEARAKAAPSSPEGTPADETDVASRMLSRIIPPPDSLPASAEVAFGAFYSPAKRTGGGLYDVIRVGKNGYAFLVADVSGGSGTAAALVAAWIKNAFRSRASWGAAPADILTDIDIDLRPILNDSDILATALYATIDLEAGRLDYASAGHLPGFLLRKRSGSAELLLSTGRPLGIEDGESFAGSQVKVEEGDRVLFYTAGAIGSLDAGGQEYGRDRLSEAFSRFGRQPIGELANAVAADVNSFTAGVPRSDDIVILVAEFRAFARPLAVQQGMRRPAVTENWRVLARRGAALAMSGDLSEAAKAYERLLEIEPEDAVALNNLGTLYWRMGRKEAAAERFVAASRVDPDDPRVVRNLKLAESILGSSAYAARSAARPPSVAAGPGAATEPTGAPRAAGAAQAEVPGMAAPPAVAAAGVPRAPASAAREAAAGPSPAAEVLEPAEEVILVEEPETVGAIESFGAAAGGSPSEAGEVADEAEELVGVEELEEFEEVEEVEELEEVEEFEEADETDGLAELKDVAETVELVEPASMIAPAADAAVEEPEELEELEELESAED